LEKKKKLDCQPGGIQEKFFFFSKRLSRPPHNCVYMLNNIWFGYYFLSEPKDFSLAFDIAAAISNAAIYPARVRFLCGVACCKPL
jgi:hypothetical protein